jgi:hypothetical protein
MKDQSDKDNIKKVHSHLMTIFPLKYWILIRIALDPAATISFRNKYLRIGF